MHMKRTWIAISLILCITGQIAALSLFHQVNASEFSNNNAVVVVNKWNYVEASITLTVTPVTERDVKIVFPDGQIVNLTGSNGSSSRSESFTRQFSFPRTGYFAGSTGASSGDISLSQDNPLSLLIKADLSEVENYRPPLSHVQNVDTLVFIIYGEALVSVSGFGVAL